MDTSEALRSWIVEHQVCWEVSPSFEFHAGRKIQVGFEVTLFARRPEALKDDPGDPVAEEIYGKLRELVLQALPQGIHPSRCDFAPFEATLHLRPERQWVPEVELRLQIVHRDSTFGEVDEDERRCADQIQDALTRLGARPRVWSTTDEFLHSRR
jgi:hypothetical protein